MKKIFYISTIVGVLTLLIYNFRTLPQAKPSSSPQPETTDNNTLSTLAQEGDIIFQTSTSSQSLAIQLATKSPYSHVGVIYKSHKGLFVFEAVNPVKTTKLDAWVKSGKDGKYVLKRLKNSSSILTKETLEKMKTAGEKYIGKKYDSHFEWSDERMYCSELVWKLYKESTGIEICATKKLSDFDLTHPEVIQIMKKRYKNKIPLNETVVSPNDIFISDQLVTVLTSD